MKVLKVIFLSILSLIVLTVLGGIVFIKVFDINKYLPPITQQAGLTINRKVNIGHANLDLGLNGLSLELKGITISDDSQFSPNDFLTLDSVHVGLDLKTLLLKHQINVTAITISNPKISVVKLANGQINVQTMVPAGKAADASPATPNVPSTPQAQASPAMALPALTVDSILVSHLQISYEDKNAAMPMQINIPDGEIKIDHFSLNAPFDFTINLNALSQGKNNIIITGQCSLDLATTTIKVIKLEMKSDLNQLDLQKVKGITSMLQNLPLPEKIQGDLSVDVPEINISSKGIQDLSPTMQIHLGAGEIHATANLHGISSTPTYDFKIQSNSVKVEDLMDQSKFPAQLNGELDADFSGTGASFDPQAMLGNLKVEGNLSIKHGKIEKLNILKTILDNLNTIPVIGSVLQNTLNTSLPENIKSQLDTDTTELTKAEAKIKVENKTINVEDAQLESTLFAIAAQGNIDFDLKINMDVKTYLSAELSTALTQRAKPLQSLYDEQNRIYLPGTVSGQAPNSIGYHPQVDYITKKVTVFEGSQQLQKVLGKNPAVANILNTVLGASNSQSQNSDQSTNTDSQTTQENPSKKIISGVLNTLFK